MEPMLITLKASIQDTVAITELNCTGIVTCIQIDGLGASYKIVYWLNGKQECAWLLEREFTT